MSVVFEQLRKKKFQNLFLLTVLQNKCASQIFENLGYVSLKYLISLYLLMRMSFGIQILPLPFIFSWRGEGGFC